MVLQQRFRPPGGPGSERPVVDGLDGRCVRGRVAIGVERSQHCRDRARRRRGAGARGAVGEKVGVALIQAGDAVAQPVAGEELGPLHVSLRVDLGQDDFLFLVGADIDRRAGYPARRQREAEERERVAEGRQRLVSEPRVSSPQQGASREEHSLPAVDHAGRMLHDLGTVGEHGGERVGVLDSDRGVKASRIRGRGVRAHAAPVPLRASGWCGRRSRHRRLGRQLVEAGERLGIALGVELLPARQETIDSEDPEHQELALVGTAAGAEGARIRPAHEERVGSQTEDVVDARGPVVRELGQGAHGPQRCLGSVHGAQSDGPGVDELDGRRERGSPALDVRRSHQRSNRTLRRRGAGACRAVGEEVGVALVQADDGVAQAIGCEQLRLSATALGVDLDQNDLLSLVGADIERAAGEPAR